MKLLISHPTGNQNVRAAVSALADEDIATFFDTTIATFRGDMLSQLSELRLFSAISRRRYDLRIKRITETYPWVELGRLAALKAGVSVLTRHEHGPFSIDAVYRNLDQHVARRLEKKTANGLKGVYAYEDGALLSFREAKRLGLMCFYDLPIGYWRAAERFLTMEKERWPDWASTLIGNFDSRAKRERKDEELLLADRIFVASQFTAKTLNEVNGSIAPVEIIPYGFPAVAKHRDYDTSINKPLKILFVGGLSQRKGIAYLFQVAHSLGRHVDLTLVGAKTGNYCPALDRALSRHRWFPSLPHSDVLKLMAAHDVLVFPSLFEGFGLVITEAMSQGTPVITTDRTAGPDLIHHGENGWLVSAGSSDSLQEAVVKILSNRLLARDTGKAALETARLRPWAVYGRELAESIKVAFKGSVRQTTEVLAK